MVKFREKQSGRNYGLGFVKQVLTGSERERELWMRRVVTQ